jgi:hypothetical protein
MRVANIIIIVIIDKLLIIYLIIPPNCIVVDYHLSDVKCAPLSNSNENFTGTVIIINENLIFQQTSALGEINIRCQMKFRFDDR